MSKAMDCWALVAKAAEKFGFVDILVNNAGIQNFAPVEEFLIEEIDCVMVIYLNSAF